MIVLTHAVTGVELRLVKRSADTNGELLEMLATYPAGSAPPPPHFHPEQHEHFEILEGSVRAEVNGEVRTLHAGETLDVPPKVIHTFSNPGSSPAKVLWQTRPALRTEEFFTELFGLARMPGLLDLAGLLPRYSREIRVVKPTPIVQRLLFGVLRPIARMR